MWHFDVNNNPLQYCGKRIEGDCYMLQGFSGFLNIGIPYLVERA